MLAIVEYILGCCKSFCVSLGDTK